MKEIVLSFKLMVAMIGGFLNFAFGGLDGIMYALIVFIVVDYITGVIAAIVQHKVSSNIGFRGIAKKVTIFLLVIIANMIDIHIIKDGNTARTAVVFFYLSNEGISIVENASRIGLPVPQKLKSILVQLKEEGEK